MAVGNFDVVQRQPVPPGGRGTRSAMPDSAALAQPTLHERNAQDLVATGSSQALVTFTTAITHQLALDLGRFLESGESIWASITKLGQQIEESRRARTQDDPDMVLARSSVIEATWYLEE
jgi:hypothetical protein